jgi:hypothetical protein
MYVSKAKEEQAESCTKTFDCEISEPEEMAVARERLGKHVFTATNTHTIE